MVCRPIQLGPYKVHHFWTVQSRKISREMVRTAFSSPTSAADLADYGCRSRLLSKSRLPLPILNCKRPSFTCFFSVGVTLLHFLGPPVVVLAVGQCGRNQVGVTGFRSRGCGEWEAVVAGPGTAGVAVDTRGFPVLTSMWPIFSPTLMLVYTRR